MATVQRRKSNYPEDASHMIVFVQHKCQFNTLEIQPMSPALETSGLQCSVHNKIMSLPSILPPLKPSLKIIVRSSIYPQNWLKMLQLYSLDAAAINIFHQFITQYENIENDSELKPLNQN